MRERTTWNRDQIAKLAASFKQADDPSVLNNPDHLKQQPSADKYLTGGPSDFAEDIHPSNNTWKAEYSGGEVKRNEIGLPEMRGDTFNHPEKTASNRTAEEQEKDEDDFLEKKADVCLNLARRMLPKNASESSIEDQAFSFMHMPDHALLDTANRMAAQEDEQESQQQEKQAQQQQQQETEEQKQARLKAAQDQQQQDAEQQKQAQQQQQQETEEQKQARLKAAQQQDQGQQDQGQQQKQAGQIPENFKKKDDEGDEDEKKQAADQMSMYSQQACAALQKGDMQAAQQAVQQMAQYAQQQPAQQQQPKMSQQEAEQQVQQMFAQMMGQQPQQTMADDQLLDQMLQQPAQVFAGSDTAMTQASAGDFQIQMEPNSMDVTEVKLGAEDEALTALFASNDDVRNALQAQSLQTGIPVQAGAGMTRTAATRTVGTRPNGGVAQLGGGTNAEPAGAVEIDKLSGLWASAPDVKSVFST